MSRGHGGNLNALAARAGRPASELLDFSANVNPLGPPDWLRPVISRAIGALAHYPDPDAAPLVEAIARHHGVPAEQVIAGNGSSELLYALPRALDVGRAVIPTPSYIDYTAAARAAGLDLRTVAMDDALELDLDALATELREGDIVILGQPNNPTGRLLDAAALRRLAAKCPDTAFVIDEAFADFVEGMDTVIDDRPANVVVVRSMTKFYAIPGLRLGYAVADEAVVERLKALLPAWTVNALAQAVGQAALADDVYARRTRAVVARERKRLADSLGAVAGLTVTPGVANYLLVRTDGSARDLADRLLLDHGIAIRVCDNYEGLDERCFRVAVRTESENGRLLAALSPRRPKAVKRRTPALMIQGTTSNAGKSVLAAALCRILLQDGVRVAPFKSQNMSLNSFVTHDGREMGRAQVVQAQACRLDPDVRMNPVLLKPTSETGSQVIVRGLPVANMHVAGYTEYKPQAFDAAKESYDSLAADFDAIVLEGAGSPAEVNLKHHDIVNMRMAAYAESPVLLAGDIDRGGVYAAFVGTLEVLEEWERALVRGFIVNRFRGDASLLGPAHDYVLRHTGRPVLGVVPYLPRLGLPEEDSVEFKSGALDTATSADGAVDIAVIDLPHISNFTDFDALRIEPDVRLRIVRSADQLGRPDAVVLPGSKNVLGDLAHLKQTGLADRVAQLEGPEIVGICGGFQMIGTSIADPHCLELTAGSIDGLGLLPLTTVLAAEKTLVRVKATHVPSSLEVHGYEIHHGRTSGEGLEMMFRRPEGRSCGVGSRDGRVWGTYLHGVFDADPFRRWFIDRLRVRRGLEPLGAVQATYDLEPAFDRLADVVRAGVDMGEVYRLMGL